MNSDNGSLKLRFKKIDHDCYSSVNLKQEHFEHNQPLASIPSRTKRKYDEIEDGCVLDLNHSNSSIESESTCTSYESSKSSNNSISYTSHAQMEQSTKRICPNNEQGCQLEPECLRKVFIGDLCSRTVDEDLREYFSKFGRLVDYIVMRDRNSGKSRHFGFVVYSTSAEVDELMNKRPHVIHGQYVEVKRAIPRAHVGKLEYESRSKQLFIGNFRDNLSEEDLINYFSPYGRIVRCKKMLDKFTRKSRGFGFIEFDDYDPVDKIVLENYHVVKGVTLRCGKSVDKEKKDENKSITGGGAVRVSPKHMNRPLEPYNREETSAQAIHDNFANILVRNLINASLINYLNK